MIFVFYYFLVKLLQTKSRYIINLTYGIEAKIFKNLFAFEDHEI